MHTNSCSHPSLVCVWRDRERKGRAASLQKTIRFLFSFQENHFPKITSLAAEDKKGKKEIAPHFFRSGRFRASLKRMGFSG